MGGQISDPQSRLDQLVLHTATHVNRWKRLTRLIATEQFVEQYIAGSEGDREYIDGLISEGDEKTLDVFLAKQRVLENYTIGELRKLGAKYKVKYYCTLTRGRLITRIRQERRRIKGTDCSDQSWVRN